MAKGLCEWMGCGSEVEATLGARPLCSRHFYEIGSRRMEEYLTRFQGTDAFGADRQTAAAFLSELISQTTMLVANSKKMAATQREAFLQLSLSAAEMFKRVQRSPRIEVMIPVRIVRDNGGTHGPELANTINVSRKGACLTLSNPCLIGEEIWVEKLKEIARARARVAWVKQLNAAAFQLGIEILDQEDFWNLAQLRKPSNSAAPAN